VGGLGGVRDDEAVLAAVASLERRMLAESPGRSAFDGEGRDPAGRD
jgi:hypothetical protein